MDEAGAVVIAAKDENGTEDNGHVLHLPSIGAFARHAIPSIVEGALGPAVVFYAVLTLSGFRGALIGGAAWSCLAVGRRLAKRERLPALLLLGLVLLAARTLIAYSTGSAFVYFLQPTIGTFLVGLLFAGSAIAKRPLIERLAYEFCPLDVEVMSKPFIRSFFLRLSVLWSVVMTVNAGLVLGLLLESSLRAFVVERTVVSYGLTTGGILLSTIWFVRVMRRAGIPVRFGRRRVIATDAAAP
ncbi:MAG TPA: VC0807 family protein [Acidimicrobiales bacterium]|nr:VC0807 family protein [Acidimicrobiales bacterium]